MKYLVIEEWQDSLETVAMFRLKCDAERFIELGNKTYGEVRFKLKKDPLVPDLFSDLAS